MSDGGFEYAYSIEDEKSVRYYDMQGHLVFEHKKY